MMLGFDGTAPWAGKSEARDRAQVLVGKCVCVFVSLWLSHFTHSTGLQKRLSETISAVTGELMIFTFVDFCFVRVSYKQQCHHH